MSQIITSQKWPTCSVIVPVGPDETDLAPILCALEALPLAIERIFVVCPAALPLLSANAVEHHLRVQQVKVVRSKEGRAVQQNAGAEVACGEYLWFLHVDSQVEISHWHVLEQNLRVAPEGMHYFRLAFADDGSSVMAINAWGANIRSRFGIPFGDQGFCLAGRVFERLQRFDECLTYGEDHLLVWHAHQARVPLVEVPATLATSARRYQTTGWLKLTLKYQWLWLRQAIPELFKLIAIRLRRN